MVWFYRRDGSSLSLETRFDNDTAEVYDSGHIPNGSSAAFRMRDEFVTPIAAA